MTGTIRCQPFEVTVKHFRIVDLEASPRRRGQVSKDSRKARLRMLRCGDFVIRGNRRHTCAELTH
jgi:hypothetical protein